MTLTGSISWRFFPPARWERDSEIRSSIVQPPDRFRVPRTDWCATMLGRYQISRPLVNALESVSGHLLAN